jgi:hypothetical protein
MSDDNKAEFGVRKFIITDSSINKFIGIIKDIENEESRQPAIDLLKEMQEVPYEEAEVQGGK